MLSRIAWTLFGLFVAVALWAERALVVAWRGGAAGAGRALVWAAFAAFLGYSLYCSGRESLPGTVQRIARLHWGRQIGIDLYLGLLLALTVVFLHERSTLVALLWVPPTLAFGNLATLLYVAIHCDGLMARLAGGG